MIVAGAVAAWIAVPATSFAATASVGPNAFGGITVTYAADPGEQNNITADYDAATDKYTFTDTGTGVHLTAGAGCVLASPMSLTCTGTGADHLRVAAGDMNDTIVVNAMPPTGTRIDGGPGNDTIVGSAGPDLITGGPGDDVIDPNDVSNVDATVCTTDALDPFQAENNIVNCPDIVDGEAGTNTLRFDHKPGGVDINAGNKGSAQQVIDPNRQRGPPPPASDCGAQLPQNCPEANVLVTKLRRVTTLIGTPGNDEIIGSSNNDTLIGRGGADTLCGGPGNDTVDYSGSTEPVNVSLDTQLPPDPKWDGNAVQQAAVRTDCRQTDDSGNILTNAPRDCMPNDGAPGEHDCVGVDVENIIGSRLNDVLIGNGPGKYVSRAAFFEPRGSNILDGGGGNDLLDGRGGADVLIGGSGTDTVDYSWETKPVTAQIGGAGNSGSIDDINPDTGQGDSISTDVENIIGGSGDDVLIGSPGDNNIQGGPGNDTIKGGGGNDVLDGGDGNDTILGGDGGDQLIGGAGNDFLNGGLGADRIDGGDGSDTVDYSNRTEPVSVTPDGNPSDLTGNDGQPRESDNVTNVESINGGSANDTLVGSPGDGVINGGAGNDVLVGGGGSKTLIGGPGLDTVSYAGRNDPVTVDLAAGAGVAAGESDTLQQIEAVTGGNGNDTISGDDGVNILDGGPGNDTIDGRGGDDQIFGGPGNDTLTGGAGNDTIDGGDGNDTLRGGDGNDTLFGGAGNDLLDGGAGTDVIAGGSGDDTVDYSSRKKDVSVTLNASPNQGEKGENDLVRADVESVKTGSGNDTINVKDGVKGEVSCGAGRDSVIADPIDTVASDCEQKSTVGTFAVCTVTSDLVNMSSRGTIPVRVSCPTSGKATLNLRTVGRAKGATKLGSKSFTLRAGKKKTVRVKLSRKALRLLKRHNGALRAHATLSLKAAATASAVKRSENVTILAPKWSR